VPGEHVGVRAPAVSSVAVAAKVAWPPLEPSASTVRSAGTVTTGGVALTTVIVKLACAEFPWPSFASQFTAVSPIVKAPPLAGEQLTGTAPATASFALTL